MNAIIRNDPSTGRWFLHLPDEPGNPVLIAETRDQMLRVMAELKRGSKARWDSSDDSNSVPNHTPSPNTSNS